MSGARWLLVVLLAVVLLVGILWLCCGGSTALWGLTPLLAALPLARPTSTPDFDDPKDVDQDRDARAESAANQARATEGQGWAEKPARDRPRLPLLLFCLLAPALVDAAAPCVSAGAGEPPPGYGLWVEQGERQWCPCLPPLEYGEVTRVAQGCRVALPLVGYTLEAHVGVAADMARAGVQLDGLRAEVAKLRRDQDWLRAQAEGKDRQLADSAGRERLLLVNLSAQETRTKHWKDQAQGWLTTRTLLVGGSAALLAALAVHYAED